MGSKSWVVGRGSWVPSRESWDPSRGLGLLIGRDLH